MPTIGEAMRAGAAQLQAAGVAQAIADARLLLLAATGLRVEDVIREPGMKLCSQSTDNYAAMIARRAAREPVSRILGQRAFWSLDFEITPDTLDPRPDSETLISAALDLVQDRHQPLRILDIGTGTGCLLLALLSEFPRAQGIGLDLSQGSLEVARRNAARLGFGACAQFIACDVRSAAWVQQFVEPFDIVISNPPYIETGVIAALAPEVTGFDPHSALDGGKDGLDFYRIITISVAQLLRPGGLVIFEIGAGQSGAVQMLLSQAGIAVLEPHYDLGGVARAILGRYKSKSAI